ncbi:MAG: 2-succinyl-5-enolpyruvyl-6-hydroxy-3-cyclohexene-1-carboxylic-acid synthase [Ilumatobacteraceae bacterium]
MDGQATFCATLVDEWVRRGIRRAVVAPGSRSTPMAIALAKRVPVDVVHDERVAGFVALGHGLDGGPPAVLLCTSGTAAANLLPAVVEAGLSGISMIVVTADRPPELRDVGAPQTIDQTHLFGRAVRWFHDPGVPDEAHSSTWRSLARRVVDAAADGPVHLNLPFRDPLVGEPGPLPAPAPVVTTGPSSHRAVAAQPVPSVPPVPPTERGVILAGGRSGVAPDSVAALAAVTGWPVLADPTSAARQLDGAVVAFDALLRDAAFATDHRPDVIVRLGRPATSKVLAQWVAAAVDDGAVLVQVGGPGVIDPDHRVAASLRAEELSPADWRGGHGAAWRASWQAADGRAEAAIDAMLLAQESLTEAAVARTIAGWLPAGHQLVVASSMPVRDLEWFGGSAARAHANRGANGIDGVMSTALGVALGGSPTVALVGDIAFVHDAGALTALAGRTADLRIVVVDNDGGGIFSFLPQADLLAADLFEQLFGTPHATDVAALAGAHHLDAATVTQAEELRARLDRPGPSVTRVPTDRAANVRLHAELNVAVAAAI